MDKRGSGLIESLLFSSGQTGTGKRYYDKANWFQGSASGQ